MRRSMAPSQRRDPLLSSKASSLDSLKILLGESSIKVTVSTENNRENEETRKTSLIATRKPVMMGMQSISATLSKPFKVPTGCVVSER